MALIDFIHFNHSYNIFITKAVGLVFPKVQSETVVVKVTVQFEECMFSYKLECIPYNKVKRTVLDVFMDVLFHFSKSFIGTP